MSLSTAMRNEGGRIYCFLLLVRTLFALYGHGYIHPDEYFQNGELTAGRILGWHHIRTWEWDSTLPSRSILPPLLTTGLPLALLHLAFPGNISSRVVFLVERLSSLILSCVLDLCVIRLVPVERAKALLLLASSHVLMTFQVRPFSNSLETSLVAVALAILESMLSNQYSSHATKRAAFMVQASFLAVILVMGIMTRITFIAFVLPIALQALLQSLELAKVASRYSFTLWIQSIMVPFCVAVLALGSAIAADSVHFLGNASSLIFTPYNNLRYNMSQDNLAKHGLHPRWLHIVVNLPLIVGPGLVIYGVLAAKRIWIRSREYKGGAPQGPLFIVSRTCIWTIVFSLIILSIQPHQEPRFLTPLIVPFTVLVANSGYLQAAKKSFWVTWVIGNALLTILFGVLHQGGVIPSLFHLNDIISKSASYGNFAIIYWKTYMPPWHLLGVPEQDILSSHVSVADLSGNPADHLEKFLLDLHGKYPKRTMVYLVTPDFAMRSLTQHIARCFKIDKRIYPHVDLDHVSESVETGWPCGMALGVYVANLDCVAPPLDFES